MNVSYARYGHIIFEKPCKEDILQMIVKFNCAYPLSAWCKPIREILCGWANDNDGGQFKYYL